MKTKTQITKQILSIFLCIVMLFSLTMPAMAAEDDTHTLYINISQVVDSTKKVSGVYLWIYNESGSILANEAMNHEYGAVYSYSVPDSYESGCIRFWYTDDVSSSGYLFDFYATGYNLYTPFGEYEGTWEVYSECLHENYTDGKCDACGEECRHENITDSICNDCGAAGTFVTITMTDSYRDGWSGNAVKIEQIIDGVYTEVGAATIETGASEIFTAVLPEDGVYAFSWIKGDYSNECGFIAKVNGEIVYDVTDASKLDDGQLIYINCEHTGGTQLCGGYKCEICNQLYGEGTNEHISEDGDSLCDVCGAFAGNEINAGDSYTVTKKERVKFIPAVSGKYIIMSVSDADPLITLYDSNMEFITDADDSGYREENDLDFYLEYEFTAGETYFFEFYDYHEEYNYTVTVIEPCSVHTGGTQTCKGFKCEVCMQWYGEAGEHTAEGDQTCLGTLCSVCGEYFGQASEHDLSYEQTCLGYYCYSCGDYYGEADPDAHNWNDTFCDICGDEHDHIGGTQTCKGFMCEVCENWYGEAGDQHDLSTEQTCKGYRCNLCYRYFGEIGEHSLSTEQTCMGYWCEYCYEWFGEADTSKHSWYYGYCDYCDAEYPVDEECSHDLDNKGACRTCGYQCSHEILENGTCTICFYALPFSLTTGETVTYHGSFPDAFDKAEDGSIIKLLKDYMDYNSVEINKAIILDLNGKEWTQPSSGSFDVTANATFTDSVGGGYLGYGLHLYSPVTFSGGSYKYIGIYHETDDMIGDYLADCSACFDRYTDEPIDTTDEEYVLGVTIKFNHNLGEQTCKGYQCEDCGEYFGEADPDAHIWRFGECIVCEYVCEHSFTNYTETKTPTCTEAGEEVAPCDYGCDAVKPKTIPALNHKDTLIQVPAQAKTCTEIGWDAYEYCTACDYTSYKEIPASHEIKTVDKKDATCTEAGHEAYEYCTECDYTTYKEIPVLGHTEENIKGYAATCENTGLTDGVKCSVCGETLTAQEVIGKLAHKDDNDDYLCDYDCGHEFDKPAEPNTPDEPTDTDCDHLCHSNNWFIKNIIWKIVQFFWKLFKMNPVCECGLAHY